MSPAQDTIGQVAVELSKLLRPLRDQLAPPRTKTFFAQLGIPLTDAQAAALATPVAAASTAADQLGSTVADLIAALDASADVQVTEKGLQATVQVGQAIAAVTSLASAVEGLGIPGVTLTADELASLIVNLLIGRYLDAMPGLNDALEFAGLLTRDDHNQDSTDPAQPPYTLHRYDFGAIGDWLSGPGQKAQALFGWGAGFDGSLLFPRLEKLLAMSGAPVIYDPTTIPHRLDVVFVELTPTTSGAPGVVVQLKANLQTGAQTVPLGDSARLELNAGFDPPLDTNVTVRSDGSVAFTPPTPTSFGGSFGAKLTFQPPSPFVIFGVAGGSRVELAELVFDAQTDAQWSGGAAQGSFDARGSLSGGKVVIDTTAGDGFLQKILPGTHVEAGFSLTMGVSSAHGFYFGGSGALEIQLPLHLALGPISIDTLTIAAGLDGGRIPVAVGADIAASLGPLNAVVQNLGVTATLSFPPNHSGNLGPLQLDIAFKPPTGAGLSIDAAIVTGGGFLSIDTTRGEYSGALQLELAEFVGVSAIGLITTKNPDGTPGFSLLIVLTADFGPGIQLSFGFTLNAVGGLLGLNRTMLFGPLMDGVRSGSIEDIMFPRDVIANAPRIVSDLRAIFPPQEGTFLIGPMAKLGWGEPTLVSLSLGVIVEIPPGDIALLGVLKLALPTEDAALLVLQVNFAGALEFSKQRLYFFASLYDSHLLFITIQGEMGLLFAYGDDANFVVSVGGFHPQFNPPPLPFPTPRRIEVDVINESYARIRCDGYFAVTTNTAQFGAHSEMFFGLSALSVQGHSGFDALIQFSPFHFTVQITTSFSVKVFGVGVWGLDIDLSLEGPTPWHAHGTASISLLFFSIDVGIDFTWGDAHDTTLPPVAVMPLVAAELGKRSNWKAQLPPGANLLVSLRQLDPSEADLVLHPVGTLQVSQRSIPLDLTLDKVGSQKPSDANRFALTAASGAMTKSRDLQEPFAPAQFKDADDATKLSEPSYSPQDSGVELAVAGHAYDSATAITRIVRYDLTIVDTKLRPRRQRFFLYPGALFLHWLGGASVALSVLSARREELTHPYAGAVAVTPEVYAVAHTADNTLLHSQADRFTSRVAAIDHLDQAVAADPALAGTLHVLPAFEVAA